MSAIQGSEAKAQGTPLVNAHTHLYSGLVPLGMPAPEPAPTNFVEILERVWWRLDRALDEPSLRASAELYVAQAIDFGTTALIDHHESPNFIEGSLDVLAEACTQFGMHALLCYGITERNGGAEEAQRGLAENERFLQRCAADPRGLLRGAVGVHASFTVSDDSLRAAGALAREYDAPLHIHVAEDGADVRDAQQRGYAGVIDRLDQLGALRAGDILAHGVHLTRDEVALASERGCWLVQNPRSNRANGVGYPQHLGLADRVALGTDGFPSEMLEEDRFLHEQALEHGEQEAAAKRLPASSQLGRALFGTLAPPEPIAPARMDEIVGNAKRQATLLWERMAAL